MVLMFEGILVIVEILSLRARPASLIMMILVASGGPTPLAPPPAMKSMPASVVSCLKPLLKCGFFRKRNR